MTSTIDESVDREREDDTTRTCPICFHSPSDDASLIWVVHPACGHVFCKVCLDRLLLASASTRIRTSSSSSSSSLDSSYTTTTLGTCPICRVEMSYFDLRYLETQELLANPNVPLDDRLQGAIFAESQGIGWGSLHFPLTFCGNDEHLSPDTAPYINLENVPTTGSARDTPSHIRFLHSTRYHAPSHTWQGQAQTTSRVADHTVTSHWRMVLAFAATFRSITRGVMLRYTTIAPTSPTATLPIMDGEWQVHTDTNATTVQIVHGIVRHESCWYQFTSNESNHITMTVAPVANALPPLEQPPAFQASWDWTSEPNGPLAVGSRLEWRHFFDQGPDPDTEPTMTWTRQTAPPSSSREIQVDMRATPMGGDLGRQFRRVDRHNPVNATLFPSYQADSVWGNVFCQASTVGLASYHFVHPPSDAVPDETEGLAYISYEHASVAHWPLLDDGQPIPSRVPFRHVSFPDPFTFRGQICWLDDHGTTWQGMSRWDYEMKFDQQFMCILSGTVDCSYSGDGSSDESRRMSTFGASLIYCNAALYRTFESRVQSRLHRDVSTTEPRGNNVALIIDPLKRRLLEVEGASQQTWSVILGFAMSAINNSERSENDGLTNSDPMDYNL